MHYTTSSESSKRLAEVTIQGNLLKVRVEQQSSSSGNRRGWVRGACSGFTQRARKRFLDVMSRLRLQDNLPSLITLTYPQADTHMREVQQHRAAFEKRLMRRYPECSGLWRIELQKRGAHHLHLLIFGLPFVPYQEVNRMWREVIGWEGYCRTEIQKARNNKQAMLYAAKYAAKLGEEAAGSPAVGGVPTPEAQAEGASLVLMSYMTADEETGRWWGAFNRAKLPYAEVYRAIAEVGTWFYQFRRLARKVYPGVSKSSGVGFTLYRPNMTAWLRALSSIGGDNLAWQGA